MDADRESMVGPAYRELCCAATAETAALPCREGGNGRCVCQWRGSRGAPAGARIDPNFFSKFNLIFGSLELRYCMRIASEGIMAAAFAIASG
jgi:hypothetical protein